MIGLTKKLFMEESGQGLAEYSLILALVAMAVIAALSQLGEGIIKGYQDTASKFPE